MISTTRRANSRPCLVASGWTGWSDSQGEPPAYRPNGTGRIEGLDLPRQENGNSVEIKRAQSRLHEPGIHLHPERTSQQLIDAFFETPLLGRSSQKPMAGGEKRRKFDRDQKNRERGQEQYGEWVFSFHRESSNQSGLTANQFGVHLAAGEALIEHTDQLPGFSAFNHRDCFDLRILHFLQGLG